MHQWMANNMVNCGLQLMHWEFIMKQMQI